MFDKSSLNSQVQKVVTRPVALVAVGGMALAGILGICYSVAGHGSPNHTHNHTACCGVPEAESPEALLQETQRSNAVYSLHEAAAAGDVDVLKLRLSEGADMEAKDELGRTPLFVAAEQHQTAAIQILIENGARVDGQDNAGRSIEDLFMDSPMPECLQNFFLPKE